MLNGTANVTSAMSGAINTTTPPPATGGGELFGVLLMLLAMAVVALLGYWALSIAGGHSLARLQTGARPRAVGYRLDFYEYTGPRRVLRDAFLRARTVLESKTGNSLKPLTAREIARSLRIQDLASLAPRYSSAMYSRRVPSQEEARALASEIVGVAEEWRAGDG